MDEAADMQMGSCRGTPTRLSAITGPKHSIPNGELIQITLFGMIHTTNENHSFFV